MTTDWRGSLQRINAVEIEFTEEFSWCQWTRGVRTQASRRLRLSPTTACNDSAFGNRGRSNRAGFERDSENVRILLPISGVLSHSRIAKTDSAKTYGNLVRRTVFRKTHEFPVPARAALIGGFTACSGKRLRLREDAPSPPQGCHPAVREPSSFDPSTLPRQIWFPRFWGVL